MGPMLTFALSQRGGLPGIMWVSTALGGVSAGRSLELARWILNTRIRRDGKPLTQMQAASVAMFTHISN